MLCCFPSIARWVEHENTETNGRLTIVGKVESNNHRSPPTLASSEITFVTQCSDDRLAQLRRTALGWNGGSLSVAVLLKTSSSNNNNNNSVIIQKGMKRIRAFVASMEKYCRMIVVVVVDQRKSRAGGDFYHYPINALRNIAICAAAPSELILLSDVDQVPSKGLVEGLSNKDIYQVVSEALLTSCTALVIPAFEPSDTTNREAANIALDGNRQKELTLKQLAKWLESEVVTKFGADTYPRGHASTNQEDWLRMVVDDNSSLIPLQVQLWPVCDYVEGYEPYLLVSRVGVPPFDERYEGYGRNKIAWVRNLAALGFSFYACPFGYLMHQPHAPSNSFQEFQQGRIDTMKALDANAAEEMRKDPRGFLWQQHVPEFLRADASSSLPPSPETWMKPKNELLVSWMSTQIGKWRTVQAATTAMELIQSQAVQNASRAQRHSNVVRLQLQQLFYMQHNFIRDEELLQPVIQSLVQKRESETGSNRSPELWVATHISVDYVAAACKLLNAWNGPTSIAIVVSPSELQEAHHAAEILLRETKMPLLVTAVIVNNWPNHKTIKKNPCHGGVLYPSNLARKVAYEAVVQSNMAVCEAEGAWIWLLDADLCPCQQAKVRLQHHLMENRIDKFAIVVTPTLEAIDSVSYEQAILASDMDSVRNSVRSGSLKLFHIHHFSAGHGPTNIEKWLLQSDKNNTTTPYTVEYETGFEPFALIHTELAKTMNKTRFPLFETSFRHPHKDKCAIYLRAAQAAASSFIVVPNVVLFAPPHEPSTFRRRQEAPDGDMFASAAGKARFDIYKEELAREFGSSLTLTDERTACVKRAEEVMRAREKIWSSNCIPDDDDENSDGTKPFWTKWKIVGGKDTMKNLVEIENNNPSRQTAFRVNFCNSDRYGITTKLLLPNSCDFEVGLCFDINFPSEFPLSGGSGGKLPGLVMGEAAEVLTSCFRWTKDGRLSFGITTASCSEVKWSRTNAQEKTEAFARGITKLLWHGPIIRNSWMRLQQELVVGDVSGVVEVRASMNDVVIVDAQVKARNTTEIQSNSGVSVKSLGEWEQKSASATLTDNEVGRSAVKLHVFFSSERHECNKSEARPHQLDLRSLTVTSASAAVTPIMVIGFHHSGTSLLRHMLGSHPNSWEFVQEIIPTPAQLGSLRNQARAAGKQFLVFKSPVNCLSDVHRAAALCGHVKIVFIQRNLSDVIFSLSQRFHCRCADLMSEVNAWKDVHGSEFARSSQFIKAKVELETLVCAPETTLQSVCGCLPGLTFDSMMISRPEKIRTNNQGTEPVTDHDKHRMKQVNGPIFPYQLHPWNKEVVEVSKEDQLFLSRLLDHKAIEPRN